MRLTFKLGIQIPKQTRHTLLTYIQHFHLHFRHTTVRHNQTTTTNNNNNNNSSSCLTSVSRKQNMSDNEYGFERPEMYSLTVGNSVDFYQRHVFLSYSSPDDWPSKVEDLPLPKALNDALRARQDDLPLKTRLTVFGSNGTEYTDGDVLIFPEMVKYKGLKESDVDAFVEDVLVKGEPWTSGAPESLVGAYVFVCAHGSRDKRCGVCGPVLLEKFKEEIESRNLNDRVLLNACSHVGGHKYAGNLIIFGTDAEGKVVGDWYGYVTPADVPDLLDVHIGKGEIIKKIWRGQMGLKVEAAEKAVENKSPNGNGLQKTEEKSQGNETEVKENITSCCQGVNGGVSCCREESGINSEGGEVTSMKTLVKPSKRSLGWLGKLEQSDVLVAAGIIGAVATVAVAYSVFRRSS